MAQAIHTMNFQQEGLYLSSEKIEAFLADFSHRSRSPSSARIYQKKLIQLCEMLPEDKLIQPGTLRNIREGLIAEGIPNQSINLICSAANSLLEFYGRRDLQLPDSLKQTKVIAPELTRTEYLRLLSTARELEKEQSYLLVKLFANTGLYVRELYLVTVESVNMGKVIVPNRGLVAITPCLCRELQDYCRRNGRYSGPIFVTRKGTVLPRGGVHARIICLAQDARVEPEKCNPITLRRLYIATQEQILASMALLIEQSHDRLFETEQLAIGWNDAR